MSSFQNARGISLLELMITLVIMAIGVMIAVPGFQQLIAANRLQTQAQEFQTAFNFARSEAIRSNSYVVLCHSGNGTTCAAPTSSQWQGWIVRRSGATVGSETGPVLRANALLDTTVIMSSSSALASADHAIRFNPQGLVRQFTTNGPYSASVKFCIQSGTGNVYQLQFSSGGQAELVQSTAACVLAGGS